MLWGGNVVSIRIGVDSVPPLWSAFWRMALGVVFVVGWARSRRVTIFPAPGEWGPLFGLGLLFTAQIGLLNMASELTSPAYGVVILNSYPVFVNLTGHVMAVRAQGPSLEERLSARRLRGLALAVLGVAVLAVGQSASKLAPKPLLGNILMMGSAILLGVRQVYLRHLVQTVDPTRAVVWQMAWSVPLFLLVALVSEPPVYGHLSWQAVAAICYQGVIVAGLCFIIWAELLKKHPAAKLSMFAFFVPVSGVALSAWIFGEPLRASLLVGGVLVLAGVWIVTRSE